MFEKLTVYTLLKLSIRSFVNLQSSNTELKLITQLKISYYKT